MMTNDDDQVCMCVCACLIILDVYCSHCCCYLELIAPNDVAQCRMIDGCITLKLIMSKNILNGNYSSV